MVAQKIVDQTVKAPACLLMLEKVDQQVRNYLCVLNDERLKEDRQGLFDHWLIASEMLDVLNESKIPVYLRPSVLKKTENILVLIPDRALGQLRRQLLQLREGLAPLLKKRKGGSRCPTLAMESMTLMG